MKIHKWLATLFNVTTLMLLTSCATTYAPNDSTVVETMNVEDARKVFPRRLKEDSYLCDGTSGWSCNGTDLITDVHVTFSRLVITSKERNNTFLYWENLPDISQSNNTDGMGLYFGYIVLSTKPNLGIMRWGRKGTDNTVVDALYVLKHNALKQKKEVVEKDTSFTASLADYRIKVVSNTALPEEANRYKVQAEGAVRDKAFYDAADFYYEALKLAPWWPVGHFNRALVLGESGEYGEAKREMNYYLQLVPDAANVRAAQDKIYEWERLESK